MSFSTDQIRPNYVKALFKVRALKAATLCPQLKKGSPKTNYFYNKLNKKEQICNYVLKMPKALSRQWNVQKAEIEAKSPGYLRTALKYGKN